MSRYNYRPINKLGGNILSPVDDPLTYCVAGDTLDNLFLHGAISNTISSQYNVNGQAFMSDRCSKNWDGYCEYASANTNNSFPNMLSSVADSSDTLYLQPDGTRKNATNGEILIHNSFAKKYMTNFGECKSCQPFDPLVADSPEICTYNFNNSSPIFEVRDDQIQGLDNDIVLNKILNNPKIGKTILINIYNTMSRKGTLFKLSNTRLGNFYKSPGFQQFLLQELNKNQ
jgi:hypothetical protein